MGEGRTTAPRERETAGRGDGAGDEMRQRGAGHCGVANETEQGKMAESAKQQPRLIWKPVAMEW